MAGLHPTWNSLRRIRFSGLLGEVVLLTKCITTDLFSYLVREISCSEV